MKLKELFDNSMVRRQDRLLDYDRIKELLTDSEYGFLSLGGESGYGIPINFVRVGTCLYFHCAPQGEKLKRIERNHQACFCTVGHTKLQPAQFSTAYESVLTFGQLYLVEDHEEKMKALDCLIDKYSPGFKEAGQKYIEKSLLQTAILRFDIIRITGKAKTIPTKTDTI